MSEPKDDADREFAMMLDSFIAKLSTMTPGMAPDMAEAIAGVLSELRNNMFTLANVEEKFRENPQTFQIPDRNSRESLMPGDHAKLIFDGEGGGERLWVKVLARRANRYIGAIDNDPVVVDAIRGCLLIFRPENIADLMMDTSS